MRRGAVPFVIFNILISAAVAFGVITLIGDNDREARIVPQTFIVVHTQPPVTPQVIVVTTTPGPGEVQRFDVPEALREDNGTAVSGPVPTLDPDSVDEEGNSLDADGPLPAGCIEYTVQDGDTPAALALEFDVALTTLLLVNDLTEETATQIQIGQALIIPLEDCPVDQFIPASVRTDAPAETTAEVTAEITEESGTATPTPTIQPTVTLAPTAADASIALSVTGVGDVTTESVEISNTGDTVNIGGWQLSDGQGNTYTFPPDRLLFSNASITLRTGIGDDSLPLIAYWNQDQAVFSSGDVVVLTDDEGETQASIRLP
jgi:hypothetical protein